MIPVLTPLSGENPFTAENAGVCGEAPDDPLCECSALCAAVVNTFYGKLQRGARQTYSSSEEK